MDDGLIEVSGVNNWKGNSHYQTHTSVRLDMRSPTLITSLECTVSIRCRSVGYMTPSLYPVPIHQHIFTLRVIWEFKIFHLFFNSILSCSFIPRVHSHERGHRSCDSSWEGEGRTRLKLTKGTVDGRRTRFGTVRRAKSWIRFQRNASFTYSSFLEISSLFWIFLARSGTDVATRRRYLVPQPPLSLTFISVVLIQYYYPKSNVATRGPPSFRISVSYIVVRCWKWVRYSQIGSRPRNLSYNQK